MHWLKCLALIPLMSAGCVQSNEVSCGGGRYCPGGTTCVDLTNPAGSICASDEQTKACDKAPRYQQCSTSSVANGRCYDGVCLAIACGNGRVDKADPNMPGDTGEACDDGNQVSGDECSADCLSTAVCGNAIVDIAKGETCDDGNLVDNDGCDSKCQAERPGWTGVTEAEPYVGVRDFDPRYEGHREDFAMAYDVAHDQVVMFGGLGYATGKATTGLDDTWVFDGHGWLQIKTDVQPIARYGHAMAYDAKRKRVVLFGGFSAATSTALSDTWEWDGERWSAPDTSQAPAPRANHVMTYDGKRDVVVLYGGDHELPDGTFFSNKNQYADTWLWDGTQWTQQVTSTAPSCHQDFLAADNGRRNAGFGFDPSRGVAVLWGGGCYELKPNGGGYNLYNYVADANVWELDASGWTSKTPSGGPAASLSARLAFSPLTKRMLVMKGDATEQWEWDGAGWTQFTGTLPQHNFLAIATDDERQRIVMHGGYQYYDTNDATYYDVRYTHEWNGSSWQLVETKPPPALALATYDIRRGRAVAVDGAGNVYERSATAWTQVAGTLSAKPRAIAYDSARGKAVVYGVNAASSTIAETWTWDGAAWTQVTGTQPPVVENPAMAFDAKRGQVVFFGGCDSVAQTCSDATWLFDGTSWTNPTPAMRPSGRSNHVLAYDVLAEKTVLFGGSDTSFTTAQDTWTWDGTTWAKVTTAATPAGRTGAALVWQPKRERLALVGGWGTDGFGRTDAWEWIGTTWRPVDAAPRIAGRGGAVVVPTHDGHALSVTGGYPRSPPRNGLLLLVDGGLLSWEGEGLRDSCTDGVDFDGDSLVGCADADCAFTCTPLCPPTEAATCGATAPRCGDASCATGTEDCRSCPVDCGACPASCSDSYCDPGETAVSCPGDC